MKKVLIGVGGVIVLLIATALIVPSFIDWSAYRQRIAEQARALSGRKVVVGGDIRLTLFPTPTLVVHDLSIANVPGGTAKDVLRLKAAEVRLAVAPLLQGRIEVSKVRLIEPVLALEVLADGRRSWTFARPATPEREPPPGKGRTEVTADIAGSEPAREEEPAARSLPAVRLNSVEIVNGTVIYRDPAAGIDERIDRVEATIRAAALHGPFEARGRLLLRGVPLRFQAAAGDLASPRLVPLRLTVSDEGGTVRAEVNGFTSTFENVSRFEGQLKMRGDNLAKAVQRVVLRRLPGLLAQPFSISAGIEGNAEQVRIKDLALRLGKTGASGEATVVLGEVPTVNVRISAGRVDLDQWLAMPAVAAAGPALPAPASPRSRAAGDEQAGSVASGKRSRSPIRVSLPSGIDVSLSLAVEAVTLRHGIIRQAQLSAELADGEITVSQIFALFPGGTDAAAFGFVTVTDGEPRFDGELEVHSADLRSVLGWLGVGVERVPPGRLRAFVVRAEVAATPTRIRASKVKLRVDSSRASGTIAAAWSGRPSFEVDLSVDRFTLDGFIGGDAARAERAAAPPGTAQRTPPAASEPPPAAVQRDLAVLDAFDADLKLRIGDLTFVGASIKDVVFDGTLAGGQLAIRRASVSDFAGASGALAGTLGQVTGDLLMHEVNVQLRVPDPARLARGLGIKPLPAAYSIGAITVGGRLSGRPAKPDIDLTVRAAGGEARLNGSLSLGGALGFAGGIAVNEAEPLALLGAFAAGYRPVGPLGATAVTAEIAADPSRVALSALNGTVAGVRVGGSAALNWSGPRPRLTADLSTGPLMIDAFLPARRAARATRRLIPASWRPTVAPGGERHPHLRRAAAVAEHWSDEPIEFGALTGFDAVVKLRSEALAVDRVVIDGADLVAELTEGVLVVSRLDGALFSGKLRSAGRLETAAPPRYALTLRLDGADLERILVAAGAKPVAAGRLSVDGQLTARGDSPAAIAGTLAGSGSITLLALQPRADIPGLAVLAPLAGKDGKGLAEASSPFTVEGGVVRFTELRFRSLLYAGRGSGKIDLPRWTIALSGQATLAKNIVGQLLTGVKEVPEKIRFEVGGPLDAPQFRVSTSGISASVPGLKLDKLRKQKGLGRALDVLLGKPSSPPAAGEPAPPPAKAAPPAATETPPSDGAVPESAPPIDRLLKELTKPR